MNKIVLSLGLLLLVSSCGDDFMSGMGPNFAPLEPAELDINHDGAINDCSYPEQMYDYIENGYHCYSSETVSNWNITPETVCCCNSEASNYSEEGWNCNPEDDTYCSFD